MARKIEAGRDKKKRKRERARERERLVSPDGLLDKGRQMEIFTRRVRNQGPVVHVSSNMNKNCKYFKIFFRMIKIYSGANLSNRY